MKRIRDERRNDRDYSKEGSADIRNAQHNLLKVIRRAATGAISLDEGAASLEIIRHILGIERDSRPEVAEEVNERDVKNHVGERLTSAEDFVSPANEGNPKRRRIGREIRIQIGEKELREKQKAARENDRHDAGLVDAKRQILTASAVDLTPANVLRALRRNTSLSLGDENDGEDDEEEEDDEEAEGFDAKSTAKFKTAVARGRNPKFHDGARSARKNTRHNQQADTVADTIFVDLFA